MHRLWAPWRRAYVEGAAGDASAAPDCFLCAFPAENRDQERGIVWRGERWYALLNAYPYSNGHLMLVLGRHHEGFAGLDLEESRELAPALGRCEAAVRAAYAPHGLNVGVNMGRVAGAGAVGHLHVHLGDATTHRHVHLLRGAPQPLLMGLLHGLGGGGALVLLVLTTLPTAEAGLLYILVFGVGSTAGMLVLSGLIGIPFALTAGGSRAVATVLQVVVGGSTMVVGLLLVGGAVSP